MARTLEEKRAFAKEHLLAQARHALVQASYYKALAEADGKFADYCVARANETLDEVVLDLMIAQWVASAATKKARLDEIMADDMVRHLTGRWLLDPTTALPHERAWALPVPEPEPEKP